MCATRPTDVNPRGAPIFRLKMTRMTRSSALLLLLAGLCVGAWANEVAEKSESSSLVSACPECPPLAGSRTCVCHHLESNSKLKYFSECYSYMNLNFPDGCLLGFYFFSSFIQTIIFYLMFFLLQITQYLLTPRPPPFPSLLLQYICDIKPSKGPVKSRPNFPGAGAWFKIFCSIIHHTNRLRISEFPLSFSSTHRLGISFSSTQCLGISFSSTQRLGISFSSTQRLGISFLRRKRTRWHFKIVLTVNLPMFFIAGPTFIRAVYTVVHCLFYIAVMKRVERFFE